VPAAILAGDAKAGVTLMLMDEGLDSGPIVAQQVVPLSGDEVAPELEHRLSAVAADLLRLSLADWLAGRIESVPQPIEGVTLTRPLRREDGRLDPAKTATELERQVRAYQPWPGSFTDIGGERVVVWRAKVVEAVPENRLGIQTAHHMLELVEVQPAGGRRMSGEDFARGRLGRLGLR
jgi:methionyl-tRNA formyltransferase